MLARKLIRANEAVIERVMDSNDLERERGITILAKTSNSPIWTATPRPLSFFVPARGRPMEPTAPLAEETF